MTETETGVVPDQGKKLLYLIRIRGDQRPPNPRRPGFIANKDARLVRNQAMLAEALDVGEPVVSRWIAKRGLHPPHPIDHLKRKELCRIYRISEKAFVSLPIAEFRRHCEAVRSDWHRIVADAPTATEAILTEMPFDLKFALFLDDPAELQRVPVTVETPFWMEFRAPQATDQSQAWSDWHILLFNHDESGAAFKCYLPRYETHEAFGVSRFPAQGKPLRLPRKPILAHPKSDAGKDFEMVLVVCHDALPQQMRDALSRDAQGPALEADLTDLAEWIDQPLQQGRAAILRAPYRVVEKS